MKFSFEVNSLAPHQRAIIKDMQSAQWGCVREIRCSNFFFGKFSKDWENRDAPVAFYLIMTETTWYEKKSTKKRVFGSIQVEADLVKLTGSTRCRNNLMTAEYFMMDDTRGECQLRSSTSPIRFGNYVRSNEFIPRFESFEATPPPVRSWFSGLYIFIEDLVQVAKDSGCDASAESIRKRYGGSQFVSWHMEKRTRMSEQELISTPYRIESAKSVVTLVGGYSANTRGCEQSLTNVVDSQASEAELNEAAPASTSSNRRRRSIDVSVSVN